MKTVELSEAKARALVAFLAPQWARRATMLAASNVPYNTPYRLPGESLDGRAFQARIKAKRLELAAIADTLAGLGVTLPDVNRAACVAMWRPAPGLRGKPGELYQSGKAQGERDRLEAAILESVK